MSARMMDFIIGLVILSGSIRIVCWSLKRIIKAVRNMFDALDD